MKLESFVQSEVKYSEEALALLANLEDGCFDQKKLEEHCLTHHFIIGSMHIVDYLHHLKRPQYIRGFNDKFVKL